jgi:acyl-CoA synthetase (NDP forming)
LKTLSEARSKEILSDYGVPVVEELVAADIAGVLVNASRIGYPVVLKGHGAALAHKSELGLVRVGVEDGEALRVACAEMAAAAGDALEGYLVQPLVSGKREFVVGLMRDPLFGPVVMFGLGGVFTEALEDVVFRCAPLNEKEALSMLDEIRAKALLGAFRGESAADTEALVATIMGVARLGVERPDVKEVDINPLIVSPNGSVSAVDALIVLGEEAKPLKMRPKVSSKEIGRIFYPRSVAFIGASTSLGKWGQSLPTNLLGNGYKGEVYLINPKGGQQWGRPVYRSIAEVPGSVDLAVITVPSHLVLGLIPELKEKGVASVLVITSGFGELGAEGEKLEDELVSAALEAGIVIFGPNTMGIQNPHADLFLTGVHVQPSAGGTTLISQSGNMGVQLLDFAEAQGLGIRSFGGSGNEAMVTIEDFMEAFEVDELTQTVLLYLESVKEGRRFFESARRVGRKKPVIILKGGRTEAGGKAAASHTGALAADSKVFEAICRQAGIVNVHQPVEMLDASAVFSSLPLPRGRRVAIMTLGGGWGVVTTDLCSDRGLLVEPLDEAMIGRLNELLPPFWSHDNPVDLVGENDMELPVVALEALAGWEGCDMVIHLGVSGRKYLQERLVESTSRVDPEVELAQFDEQLSAVDQWEVDFANHSVKLMERFGKPIVGVKLHSGPNARTILDVPGSKYDAVSFPSPERAVKALAYMCDYSDFVLRED